jgi:hypothetical protein
MPMSLYFSHEGLLAGRTLIVPVIELFTRDIRALENRQVLTSLPLADLSDWIRINGRCCAIAALQQ